MGKQKKKRIRRLVLWLLCLPLGLWLGPNINVAVELNVLGFLILLPAAIINFIGWAICLLRKWFGYESASDSLDAAYKAEKFYIDLIEHTVEKDSCNTKW